jgi:hypothetical protein
VTPKFVSPADPAARWTGAHGGQAFSAYSTNYLIDTDNAIIVDVEATTAIRQAEVLAARRMIERSMKRFDLYPARLMGDSAYGSAEMLGWLVHEHGIEPYVTVFDKSARKDGSFARDDFTYDHERDIYVCPGGKTLTTTGTLVNDDTTMAVERMTMPELARLRDFLTHHANQPELAAGSAYYQRSRDEDYHFTIVRAARCERLEQMLLDELYYQLRIHRLQSSTRPGRAQQALGEHREILEALASRNPDAAEGTMRHHIRNPRVSALSVLDGESLSVAPRRAARR